MKNFPQSHDSFKSEVVIISFVHRLQAQILRQNSWLPYFVYLKSFFVKTKRKCRFLENVNLFARTFQLYSHIRKLASYLNFFHEDMEYPKHQLWMPVLALQHKVLWDEFYFKLTIDIYLKVRTKDYHQLVKVSNFWQKNLEKLTRIDDKKLCVLLVLNRAFLVNSNSHW